MPSTAGSDSAAEASHQNGRPTASAGGEVKKVEPGHTRHGREVVESLMQQGGDAALADLVVRHGLCCGDGRTLLAGSVVRHEVQPQNKWL